MEKDYCYSAQVNRRLTATRFLIGAYENHCLTSLVASEKQAYIDSILLQLYFVFVSYCNELLSHHRKPVLNDKDLNLTEVFGGDQQHFSGISQFNELRVLYDQKSSGLAELCRLFDNLSAIGSKEEQEKKRLEREQLVSGVENSSQKNNQADTINLVNVDAVKIDLSNISQVKQLLDDIQDLIDRQREYLIEY